MSEINPDAQQRVDDFNTAHPVGSPVTYWPSAREGKGRGSVTGSKAWVLGGHTPVVLVEGYPGGIALTHVEPRPAHFVTVSRKPDDDHVDIKSSCFGACAGLWVECRPCAHTPTEDEKDDGVYIAHGIEHVEQEGCWSVPAPDGDCALNWEGGRQTLEEAVWHLPDGRHEVSADYWGDGEWVVDVIENKEQVA